MGRWNEKYLFQRGEKLHAQPRRLPETRPVRRLSRQASLMICFSSHCFGFFTGILNLEWIYAFFPNIRETFLTCNGK